MINKRVVNRQSWFASPQLSRGSEYQAAAGDHQYRESWIVRSTGNSMRMKRTFELTMRDAFTLVKQERGGDLVIRANQKMPGGVEILSPIDIDLAAVSRMAKVEPEPKILPSC